MNIEYIDLHEVYYIMSNSYYHIRMINAVSLVLVILLTFASISIVIASSSSSRPQQQQQQQQQRYHTSSATIKESPLCAAVACRDGVVMVAFHQLHSLEPLLYDSGDNMSRMNLEDEIVPVGEKLIEEFGFRQLISSSKISTPRITCFDSEEGEISAMCAGWRSDVSMFMDKCRDILANTKVKYGTGNVLSLVREVSTWMTACEFSDQVRPIDCVGLLVSSPTYNVQSPCLFIVSPYSYQRLRAVAIGKGSNRLNIEFSKTCYKNLSANEALLEMVKSIREAFTKDEPLYSFGDTSLEINLVKQE